MKTHLNLLAYLLSPYVKDGEILKEWDVDTYEKVSFMKYYGIEKLEEKKSGGGLQLELKDGASPW